MSARTDLTIVLVLRESLARADFTRAGRLVDLHRQARPLEGTLGELAEAAIRQGGRVRGAVWVLASDVFSQVVALPAGAMQNLGQAETATALAYEAQLLTGVAPSDGALAFRALPEGGHEREFWVTQVASEERDQLDAVARRHGGRLAGICHPAGLPWRVAPDAPSTSDAGGAWERVEYWHDVVATVTGSNARVVVRIRRADRRSVDLPLDGAPTEYLEAADGLAPPSGGSEPMVRLHEEAALRAWLSGWAAAVLTGSLAVPAVAPAARPWSFGLRLAASATFLVLVAALCGAHYVSARARRETLAQELFRARAPLARSVELQKELARLEREAAELRGSTALLGSGAHLPALLEALAARCPEGVAIEALEIGWERAVVHGVCVEPQLVDRLAGALTEDVAVGGRRVVPGIKRFRDEGANAGLYEFELEVASPPEPAAPPRGASR